MNPDTGTYLTLWGHSFFFVVSVDYSVYNGIEYNLVGYFVVLVYIFCVQIF